MKHRYILVVPKNEKCQSNFKSIEKNINNKLTHKYNIQCNRKISQCFNCTIVKRAKVQIH